MLKKENVLNYLPERRLFGSSVNDADAYLCTPYLHYPNKNKRARDLEPSHFRHNYQTLKNYQTQSLFLFFTSRNVFQGKIFSTMRYKHAGLPHWSCKRSVNKEIINEKIWPSPTAKIFTWKSLTFFTFFIFGSALIVCCLRDPVVHFFISFILFIKIKKKKSPSLFHYQIEDTADFS